MVFFEFYLESCGMSVDLEIKGYKLIFDLFKKLKIFHVFLVLNIISIDQNKNLHIFYKKNSKVELHSSKTFFWWPNSNFAIFSCKMSVTFEFGHEILCLET